MPDITRLFKGIHSEFEVEVVFATSEDQSPREAHDYEEFIFLAEGSILLERSDKEDPESWTAPGFIHLPAGVTHVIDARTTPAKLVIIHPDRMPQGPAE